MNRPTAGAPGQALVVPVYYNSSAGQLEIYAALGSGSAGVGTVEPYSFDTGAPNLFATYGSWWPGTTEETTEGATPFTFAQSPTYYYNLASATVTLSDASGQSLATVTDANVAQITNVAVYGNGTTASEAYENWSAAVQGVAPLGNGTFGDFGVGLYGNSDLGTILAQIPLSSGLEAGFIVDAPSSDAAPGTVTLGLSPATIAAWKSNPDTLILTMSATGGTLPNPDGTEAWSSFAKAQASDTKVTLTSGGSSFSFPIGLVIDTDGGASNNIYTTGDIDFPSWVSSGLQGDLYTLTQPASAGGSAATVLSYTVSGTLPAGGDTSIDPTKSTDFNRDNPGFNLFLSYTVMFDVADDEVLLQPITAVTVGSGASSSGLPAFSGSDRLTVQSGGTALGAVLSGTADAFVSGTISNTTLTGWLCADFLRRPCPQHDRGEWRHADHLQWRFRERHDGSRRWGGDGAERRHRHCGYPAERGRRTGQRRGAG